MARYIKVENGVPREYSIPQLKKDNPSVSFSMRIPPSTLAEYGVYELVPTDPPAYDKATQAAVDAMPEEISPGVWEQRWRLRPKGAEERAQYQQQEERKAILAAVKADPEVRAILTSNGSGIDQYIENNVRNLSSAKRVIAANLRATAALAAMIRLLD